MGDVLDLNYPFYIYPTHIYSEYKDTKEYIYELKRLYTEINELKKEKEKILFHLSIGAAMEEYNDIHKNEDYVFQWQQLFPIHLRTFADNNKETKIVHFIISPNETFSSASFKHPEFTKYTQRYNFDFDEKTKTYTSTSHNIIIKIFCTMMPTIHRDYSNIMECLTNQKQIEDMLKIYKRTESDKEFVKRFYDSLQKTMGEISKNNGAVTCFSFAVFNQRTIYKTINNFKMFHEIINIFNEQKKYLLAEWVYREGSFQVFIGNTGISYVDIDVPYEQLLININNCEEMIIEFIKK